MSWFTVAETTWRRLTGHPWKGVTPRPSARDEEHDLAAIEAAHRLRTIAAHRAILTAWRDAESRRDYYVRDGEEPFASEARGYAEAMDRAVRLLAAIYQDRPGYDPRWATG